ncbi:hypothetical protein CWO90_08450 [Bradyrhizobium sp. Leo121]|nr:hypothetical protein CWO90_08450 [Bradyrhizobium sp. Leo121]
MRKWLRYETRGKASEPLSQRDEKIIGIPTPQEVRAASGGEEPFGDMGRRRLSIAHPIEPILKCPDIGQKIKNRIVLAAITDHNPNPAFMRILENRFHIAPMFVHLFTRVEKHKAITLAMEMEYRFFTHLVGIEEMRCGEVINRRE